MKLLPSSFRDPSGFVFLHEDCVYRQVNTCFAKNYEKFMSSGLYQALVSSNMLVPHKQVDNLSVAMTSQCHKIIKPQQIPFISYPYEWSFSQLKDAAIHTLQVQSVALKHGFTLKDASAYNIQFVDSRPIFIDTLSLEPYIKGQPWAAYRQFCQHFLAPLALMSHVDIEISKMLATHIDGIPLTLASKMLPLHTRLNYALQIHIHIHAKMQTAYADTAGDGKSSRVQTDKAKGVRLSVDGLQAIIESLAKTVKKLKWKLPKTEWGDYYNQTNYGDQATLHKREIVDTFLSSISSPMSIIQDLGANEGEFSRIAAKYSKLVVSQDIDPVAVERNYRQTKKDKPQNILPLIQNLFSPSSAIGWANEERDSFVQRAKCDVILALALVHHLAISNNLPLANIAILFSSLVNWLIIEFVPKSDSQVARLLKTRKDIFVDYSEEGFEFAFARHFSIEQKVYITGSNRVLYLMKSK